MNTNCDLIVRTLLAPKSIDKLTMLEWDLLIRQGRSANLLGRLAYTLVEDELIDTVPLSPRQHLISALKMAQRQDIALRWEINCIRQALSESEVKLILLKGAAYVMGGLNAANGRTFSDVDILVPKEKLALVESDLTVHGWQGAHHDSYDQRYYRQWMHEIPPMRHIRRGTTIDVHHTILPETARVKVNTAALFANAFALQHEANIFVLPPADMLLHSATHLFHEGDFEKGLRDLFDLDSLLRQFGRDDEFWRQLVPRAIVLGLARPLYYALRYTTSMLGTPVPESVINEAKVGAPNQLILKLIDACYFRALRPVHGSCRSIGTWPARFLLYVRSHWIRMPFHLLAYHLGRKVIVNLKGQDEVIPQDEEKVKI
jgi:hypothetical protein